MIKLGVTESYKLKRQVVLSASEAAEMILRYAIMSQRRLWLTTAHTELMIFYGRHRGVVRLFE